MDKQLKKWFIVGTIFIILFGSLFHFIYAWSGNNQIVGIIGAVNESTWEHTKLLFWPALFFSLVEYIYIGHRYENYITSKAISMYLGIFLIISLFYTYTGIIGNHFLVVDILIFIISILVSQYIGYKVILSANPIYKKISTLSLVLIVLLLFLFVVFTFTPPRINLFKDPRTGKYGIG